MKKSRAMRVFFSRVGSRRGGVVDGTKGVDEGSDVRSGVGMLIG